MANVFNEDIEGVKALIGLIGELKKDLKGLVTQTEKASKSLKFDNVKDIAKVDDEIKKITEAEKELIKVQKEEAKLQKQLKQLTDEEVKAKLRFQKANKAQKDELKDLLILQNKESGTLEKLTASSRKLRREREKLNLDTAKGKKRLQEINKQLDKNNKKIKDNSDALKKQRLNVGNYSDSIKEAAQSSGLFGGILSKLSAIQGTINALTKKQIVSQKITTANTYKQIIATETLTKAKKAQIISQKALNQVLKASPLLIIGTVIGGLVATFTRTQKRVDQLSDAMASMGAIVDIVIDRFSQIGEGTILIFNNALNSFKSFQLKLIIGAKKLKLEMQEALSFEIAGKKFGFAEDSIVKTTKELEVLNEELKGLESTASGVDLITSAFDGLGDEIEREIALASTFNQLRRELNREQKIFSIQLNDEIASNKELQLIVRNKIIDDNERLKALEKIRISEAKISNQKILFAERELTLSLDAVELDKERLKFIDQLRKGQITSEEAIKKAEQFTLSSSAGEEALFNIIDKINNLKKEEIEFDTKLVKLTKQKSGLLKEIGAKQSKAILVVAQNELKLAKQIGTAEEDRIKNLANFQEESIRAYKVQLDANIITLEEFNARRLQAELIVQQELIKLQTAKESAEFKLQEFRLQNQIKNEKDLEKRTQKELELNALRTTKLLEKEGLLEDEKTLLLEQEEARRKEILAKSEKEKLKLKEEANKKELEQQKEYAKKSQEVIGALADVQREAFNERQTQLDEEISASEKQQERLKELAERGSEDAKNNQASEKKREAELRKQKQQEIEEQKRTELLFTALDSYSGRIANGDSGSEALAGTITDIALLSQAIKSLPFFKDGTDSTGTVANPLDKDGGRLAMIHNNEGIFSEKQMGDMDFNSRDYIIDNYHLAESYKRGELVSAEQQKISVFSGGSWLSNNQVIEQLSSIEQTLSDLPKNMPETGLTVDQLKGIMTLTKSQNGQINNTHFKINNRKSWS